MWLFTTLFTADAGDGRNVVGGGVAISPSFPVPADLVVFAVCESLSFLPPPLFFFVDDRCFFFFRFFGVRF